MVSFRISQREAGQTLVRIVQHRCRLSERDTQNLIRTGKVLIGRRPCHDPARRLRRGQQVIVHLSSAKKKQAAAREWKPSPKFVGPPVAIRYVDPHIVVVDKPAGLTTVRHAREAAEFGARAKRFLPPTLVDLLPGLLSRLEKTKAGRVRAVHRLDRDTSGLVVLARTAEAERNLGLQFRAHTIERKYLAIVRGRTKSERIESYLVADRGDGRRGTPVVVGAGSVSDGQSPSLTLPARTEQGQRAVTHVRVLEEFGEFTLVECRLETGRTHQVRIHLGERGTPLCGERIYDRPLGGRPFPDPSNFPRPALHAAELAITHPATGRRMHWTSPLPEDMRGLLARLRR